MTKSTRRFGLAVAVLGLMAGAAGRAKADLTLQYVGQWEVDQGPNWTTNPPVYSGQEAAALLFGGSASDYAISTVDSNPADVNHMAWYSEWGVGGGQLESESLHSDTPPPGYNNPGGSGTAFSAYVQDNAIGSQYTNYAFLIENTDVAAVPEPSTLASAAIGIATALGGYWWKRRGAQAKAA